jgi:hypothetical protein
MTIKNKVILTGTIFNWLKQLYLMTLNLKRVIHNNLSLINHYFQTKIYSKKLFLNQKKNSYFNNVMFVRKIF